jgi:hypothetical protein
MPPFMEMFISCKDARKILQQSNGKPKYQSATWWYIEDQGCGPCSDFAKALRTQRRKAESKKIP